MCHPEMDDTKLQDIVYQLIIILSFLSGEVKKGAILVIWKKSSYNCLMPDYKNLCCNILDFQINIRLCYKVFMMLSKSFELSFVLYL